MIEVSFFPILAAGIASVLIAFVWYHPSVFGGIWVRLNPLSPEMAEKGKRRMPLYVFIALLASMLAAYVMSYFGMTWQVYDWIGAIELGFWCWLGFTAVPMLGMVLWEQKPFRVYLIVAFQWLITFIVMAIILVVGSNILNNTVNGTSGDLQSDYLSE